LLKDKARTRTRTDKKLFSTRGPLAQKAEKAARYQHRVSRIPVISSIRAIRDSRSYPLALIIRIFEAPEASNISDRARSTHSGYPIKSILMTDSSIHPERGALARRVRFKGREEKVRIWASDRPCFDLSNNDAAAAAAAAARRRACR